MTNMKKKYVKYISDKDFLKATQKIVTAIKKARTGRNYYKNTIDPFSAVFEASVENVGLGTWFGSEKSRQVQKSWNESIGDFHEDLFAAIPGWDYMDILDVKNDKKKIIAELKNKWNTTKGDHKVKIYDNIHQILSRKEYAGYKGYYVEVLPKDKKIYDVPFTPSDNVKKTKRPANKNIRKIDGRSFYKLATGDENAMKNFYNALPKVLAVILKTDTSSISKDPMFKMLIDKAIS